jgi:hypothetical protein
MREIRERLVWDASEGRLRPWAEVAARRRERARSSLPAPSVIRDELDGVKNPVDGKTYDSKSAYYRAVKSAGCEIVGNDASIRPYAAPDVKTEEIGAALHKVKQGYKPEIQTISELENYDE